MSKTRKQKRRKGRTPEWMKAQYKSKTHQSPDKLVDELAKDFKRSYDLCQTNLQKIKLIENRVSIFAEKGVPDDMAVAIFTRCIDELDDAEADSLLELWENYENNYAPKAVQVFPEDGSSWGFGKDQKYEFHDDIDREFPHLFCLESITHVKEKIIDFYDSPVFFYNFGGAMMEPEESEWLYELRDKEKESCLAAISRLETHYKNPEGEIILSDIELNRNVVVTPEYIFLLEVPFKDLRIDSYDRETYLGEYKDLTRKAGNNLFFMGGENFMHVVANDVPTQNQRELEVAWDGIGGWRC